VTVCTLAEDEIIDTMFDLKDCGVDIFTLGQYLQPTPKHLSVVEMVTPEAFEYWRRYGEEEVGFRYRLGMGWSLVGCAGAPGRAVGCLWSTELAEAAAAQSSWSGCEAADWGSGLLSWSHWWSLLLVYRFTGMLPPNRCTTW
jgi:hypothetical protein